MKLLLDTHAFIWWDSEPSKLPSHVLSLCESQENSLLLSVASVSEMQIKLELGKLRLRLPLAQLIEGQQQTNGVELLTVRLEHVLRLGALPAHHRDPFDRMLIAQAQVEDIAVVSGDPLFRKYPAKVIW
ncbi:MAG: type II toxin-antitoxin system VapC family toxin [Planctomycetes bacterium]|nr:type II toxin-antitoxin system VapC family toxin [Planctomycetota bacterium]